MDVLDVMHDYLREIKLVQWKVWRRLDWNVLIEANGSSTVVATPVHPLRVLEYLKERGAR